MTQISLVNDILLNYSFFGSFQRLFGLLISINFRFYEEKKTVSIDPFSKQKESHMKSTNSLGAIFCCWKSKNDKECYFVPDRSIVLPDLNK